MKNNLIIAYAKKNLGDDLFLHILAKRYPKNKFYICSKTEYNTKELGINNLKVVNTTKLDKLNEKVFKNKLKLNYNNIISKFCSNVILIGGSMFIQNFDTKKSKEILDQRFSKIKKDYYILGSNFGPYKNKEYFEMHKQLFSKAKDVCFREEYSYNIFKDLNNVRVAPDIVFSLDTKDIQVKKEKQVVISVIDLSFRKELSKYEEDYINKIIEINKYYKEKGYKVILMSFCKAEKDEEAIEKILNKSKEEIEVYKYDGNIKESLELIASSEIMIATRFHAMILGFIFGIQVLPISYSEKTVNVLKDLNYEGKTIKIQEINKMNTVETLDNLSEILDVNYAKNASNLHFLVLDKNLNN